MLQAVGHLMLEYRGAKDLALVLHDSVNISEAVEEARDWPARSVVWAGLEVALPALRAMRPAPSAYVLLAPKESIHQFHSMVEAGEVLAGRSWVVASLGWEGPLPEGALLYLPDTHCQTEYLPQCHLQEGCSEGYVLVAGGEEAQGPLAHWSPSCGLHVRRPFPPALRRTYLRVATTYKMPFAYPCREAECPERYWVQVDGRREEWGGYCLDAVHRLCEELKLECEVTAGQPGQPDANGSWSGVTGSLQRKEIDMIFAPISVSEEREKAIDFIPPTYESNGFLLVARRPVKEHPLFKFVTVLRWEVWLSLVLSLVMVALLIWAIELYSPVSSLKGSHLYPFNIRQFTLKECFWFCATSFTQQGGGEAPRPLSSRVLVASYWVFAILMLAAFTSNLAAFLTVDRLQYPIQSFDQLIRQSRINYTVINGSDAHIFFINMKKAEDTLYRAWTEHVWKMSDAGETMDLWMYPVAERYARTLLAIHRNGIMHDREDAYKQVISKEQGELVLIDEEVEVMYRAARDCRLMIIGEPFARKPFSVALQQPSALTKTVSSKITTLLRNKFFENLMKKYTDPSIAGECKDGEMKEGISIEVLGGVFVGTLAGVGVALVTLAVERSCEKASEKKEAKESKEEQERRLHLALFTVRELGAAFKPPPHASHRGILY